MSLAELILADVRQSARRAHRCFRATEPEELEEARRLSGRIAVLLSALRERYDTDAPFHQLVREAIRRGLPEAFAADLFFYDRGLTDAMAKDPRPARFVWILHDCGTFLLDAREGETPSYLAGPFTRNCGRHHVYLFEGGRLTEIGPRGEALAA